MPTVDPALVRELKGREDARFAAEHPKSLALLERGRRVMPNGVPMAWHVGSYHHPPPWAVEGHGARFSDVDGHTYSDFNIADMSMFCGYAPEPLVRAVSDRIARGHQFLLPVEDAIVVSEELARRYGLPMWQYTLSASQANTEAIRVARVVTGRDKVLLLTASTWATCPRLWSSLDPMVRTSPRSVGSPAKRWAARSSWRSTTRPPWPARWSGGISRSC
jgi:glutamate-1-semialdehyde 2,1-aminomutase